MDFTSLSWLDRDEAAAGGTVHCDDPDEDDEEDEDEEEDEEEGREND